MNAPDPDATLDADEARAQALLQAIAPDLPGLLARHPCKGTLANPLVVIVGERGMVSAILDVPTPEAEPEAMAILPMDIAIARMVGSKVFRVGDSLRENLRRVARLKPPGDLICIAAVGLALHVLTLDLTHPRVKCPDTASPVNSRGGSA